MPALAAVLALMSLWLFALQAAAGGPGPPVAPRGSSRTVRFGQARFSIYTAGVLRLEWSSASAFDDLPSMTIVNRSPPVPSYTQAVSADGSTLTIRTALVTLVYNKDGAAGDFGKATDCSTLNVSIASPGATSAAGAESRRTVWCPAMGMAPPSQQNLNGSLETGDCYVGWADCIDVYDQKMQPGIISRAGYALINDTSAVLLEPKKSSQTGADWPDGWRLPRPHASGSYTDLLFFGHGHDYRAAMADWRLVAGSIPLSPWRSTGVWWTRYYPYSEKTWTTEVWDGFVQYGLPLHMLVLDTDWCVQRARSAHCIAPGDFVAAEEG
jgi:alpha-glucosidase